MQMVQPLLQYHRSHPQLYFQATLRRMIVQSRLAQEEAYIQHGNTSCLLHSIAVAYLSYRVARFLRVFREEELIRGALLHDYFLYDWHEPDHPFHGFHHPRRALENAREEFQLSQVEEDIIRKHMFPLTLSLPKYKESVLICLIDKICSVYETMQQNAYANGTIHASLCDALACAP